MNCCTVYSTLCSKCQYLASCERGAVARSPPHPLPLGGVEFSGSGLGGGRPPYAGSTGVGNGCRRVGGRRTFAKGVPLGESYGSTGGNPLKWVGAASTAISNLPFWGPYAPLHCSPPLLPCASPLRFSPSLRFGDLRASGIYELGDLRASGIFGLRALFNELRSFGGAVPGDARPAGERRD